MRRRHYLPLRELSRNSLANFRARELRDRARAQLLEFTWSQWAQAGLSAHPTRSDRWALDPEALILFTLDVARRDPRLFDELLDWLARNRRLLSFRRLRNLTARFPVDPNLVEAVVDWASGTSPSLRRAGADRREGGRGGTGIPLFADGVLAFVGEADPVFERHGYLRPTARPSGKSSEPDARASVNLAFRLRLLFGPGGRSEVMRILVTVEEGALDAARIADEAGFAKRNVNEVLAGLVASGVVTARWSRNERVFLAPRNRWATLLEIGPSADHLPTFVSWIHLLPAIMEILSWVEREAESTDSEYLVSSRARDLAERIAPDLETAGFDMPASGSLPGAAYLPAFSEAVESLLITLRGRS